MRKGQVKGIIALLIVFFMVAGLVPWTELAVFANTPERQLLGNDYISVSVSTGTGRYAIRTTGGDPGRESDRDKSILYEKEVPETSYTSFNIDGDKVIFGNSYGNLAAVKGYFVRPPAIEGNKCITVWKYKDVEITQTIELLTKSGGDLYGNARVSYGVKNTSQASVKIGTRILLDVMAGDNDGAVLLSSGDIFPIAGERILEGDDVPLYWRALDSWESPKVAAYGMLYGWGEAKPSKLVFGHWNGLSAAKWDYDADQWLDYTSGDNMYGTGDSAVAAYWEEAELKGGESRVFSTLVGMGDMEGKDKQENNLSVNITAPKKVIIEGDQQEPFEITAEIDNTYEGAADQANINVDIAYPQACRLIEGNKTAYVPELKKNETVTVKWKFDPSLADGVNVYAFTVGVDGESLSSIEAKAYVVMAPSFVTPPSVQYAMITPNKMYVNEMDRRVSLSGNNLNYLKNDMAHWEVYLQDKDGGRIEVIQDFVTVESNHEMIFSLPDGLDQGSYGLGIDILGDAQLGSGFFRDNVITISDDVSLMRRGYGTLAVTKKEKTVYDGQNREYTFVDNFLHYAKGNNAVQIPDGEKEVLRLTGNIQKLTEGKYSIIPSKDQAVYFGKILKLTTEEGYLGELTVELRDETLRDEQGFMLGGRDQNQAFIEGGNGCRIFLDVEVNGVPQMLPKPLIWKNAFECNVNSFVIKNPDVIGLNEDVMAWIGQFKLGIQEFKVVYDGKRKMYAADFMGRLDIMNLLKFMYKMVGDTTNKARSKLLYADIQVDSFRVYEDGTIGFNTEVGIGLPQMKLGTFVTEAAGLKSSQTGGAEGRLRINTLENLYSIFARLTLPDFTKVTDNLYGQQDDTSRILGRFGIFVVNTPLGPVPFPDTIEAEFNDNMGFISIPQLPLTICQLGGGVYNLHELRDAIEAGFHPDLSGSFWFGITDTKTPPVFGKRMFSAKNCKISVGTQAMSLSGMGYLYHFPVAEAEIKVMFYPTTGAYMRGMVSIMDVIVGEAKTELSYNHENDRFYAGGYVRGYIQIPNYSPILPGFKLADASASVSTDYVQAYAKMNMGVFVGGVGVRYTWADAQTSFFSKAGGNGSHSVYAFSDMTEDGVSRIVDIGTNLYAIEVKPDYAPGRTLAFLGSGLPYGSLALADTESFYSNGRDPLIIQAKYAKGVNIMPVTLTDPDGVAYPIYTEGENQNVFLSEYQPENGDAKNYMAIMVPAEKNKAGNWTIQCAAPSDFEVYGLEPAAEIKTLNVTKRIDGDIDVAIELDREAEDSAEYGVDLYLESTDREKELIIQLVKDGEINGESGSFTVSLPPEVETGDYRIMAGLNRYQTGSGGAKESVGYSQAKSEDFHIENANTPTAPVNVSAGAVGNGAVNVEWDAVDSENVTGYYVFAADENGNIAEGATSVFIPAADGQERYEAQISGWQTGREYNVVIQALRVEDSGQDPGNDDGTMAVDSELSELGSTGAYRVIWQRIDGIDSYAVILTDNAANEEITVPYYNNDSSKRDLQVTIRELRPGANYQAQVKGIKEKNLLAGHVEAEDLDGGATKTISWDRVELDNIEAYSIVGKPAGVGPDEEETDPLVMELDTGELAYDGQLDRYTATVAGFEDDKAYAISVVAKQKAESVPARYMGALSEPYVLMLPEPQPPDIDISCLPTDLEGSGTVQVLYDDGANPTFLTNVNGITLSFASDAAVKSEMSVKAAGDMAEGEAVEMDGKQWLLPVAIEDGINEITIRSYNGQGDYTEKTWRVSCKTAPPSLLMNDTVVSGGVVYVSGITDTDAAVYVNGNEAEVDSGGCFTAGLPQQDKALVDVKVRVVDHYMNENIYRETVWSKQVMDVAGVAVELDGSMAEGSSRKLKLFAYDRDNNRMEIPDSYVTWTLVEGAENAEIANGTLKALKEGQCVVSAGYKVSGDFAWTDAVVVDIIKGDGKVVPVQDAYLTGLAASFGRLEPDFSPEVLSYRLTIPYNLASIWLRPVSDLENVNIRINGQIVENGESSKQLPVDPGDNSVDVAVESPGMYTRTYSISVYRQESRDTEDSDKNDRDSRKRDTKQTVSPTSANGNIAATAKLDKGTGVAAANIDTATFNAAFDKAAQNSDGKKAVEVAIPTVEGARAYELTLPAGALSSYSVDRQLKIKTGIAEVTVSGDMLEQEATAGAQNVSLTIAQADLSGMDEETRNRIGGRPVIELSLKVDGEPYAWSNENAPVTVSIPYTPTAQELADPEHITIWYIDGQGNVVEVPSGRYDPVTGTVNFSTNHFSSYAVAYVHKTFNDLGSAAWAKKPIEVLASKGILRGTTEKEYAPQANITRADFLYFLVRTLGVEAKFDVNFSDISSDAYYYKEIGIARKLGITGGTGNNKFSPEASITRQDMMVMTGRALKLLKKLEVKGAASDLEKFVDRDLIADYAADSAAAIVKSRLMIGSGDKLNPLGNTTRAEAAVLLYRIYDK